MSEKYDIDSLVPSLLAQLEVHEILLSGLYANWVAGASSEEFGDRLMAELKQAGERFRDRPTGDPQEIEFMIERQRHITAALERFAAKTLKRGREIREAQPWPPANDEG